MNIKEELQKILSPLAKGASFSIEKPEDPSHGDYSTNIAFVASKVAGTSPKVWAEENAKQVQENLKHLVSKVEVAGPGFINFFLLDEVVRKANSKKEIHSQFQGKHVLVEHTSPNLFKPFHIGHLMNNIVGEFVSRAVEKGGANVQTLCFPSDISFGIAKAIYVWKKDKEEGKAPDPMNVDKDTMIVYFGECYVRGVALHKDHPELDSEMRTIANALYTKQEGEAYELWKVARELNSSYFEDVVKSIGGVMGKPIYESDVEGKGKELVENAIGTVFTKSEGAVVYIPAEERKDLNTSVFINSEGHPTYEAKDLGLIYKKFTEYGNVDLSYFITDSEQSHHFKIVLDAASKINDEWKIWAEKSKHITHGRMLFKGAKMSSRLGGVPLALDVIAAVEDEVRERSSEKIAHITEEERNRLVREVALSALRIAVLRSKPGLNINFDPETSISFEGDSGPYLMYTHARTCSLLDKGRDMSISPVFGTEQPTDLERSMLHYEDVLVDAINTLSPQKIVTYLFSIAQAFNAYYASNQILIEGDTTGNAHRLAIVLRVKEILHDGLYVLGCKAQERM
jgi:arginyl-tRNA synthetase